MDSPACIVYCLLRSDRGVTSVTETSSSSSAAARAVERVRERRLRSATRFAIRARDGTRESHEKRKKHFARGKKERLSATSDAIEPGAGGGRTSLPPWPSYTPKKAVSSSRPRTVAWASCGRRPVVGSVSAGEGGVGRSCGGRASLPRARRVSARKVTNFRSRARAAARRGTRSTQPATDTAALAYLHIRAPPLHRRSAVLEPSILPVRALLVRDGLTQMRPIASRFCLLEDGATEAAALHRGRRGPWRCFAEARGGNRGDGRVPTRCVCVMSGATARRECSAAATRLRDAKPLYC